MAKGGPSFGFVGHLMGREGTDSHKVKIGPYRQKETPSRLRLRVVMVGMVG